jgi:hypothetical protein
MKLSFFRTAGGRSKSTGSIPENQLKEAIEKANAPEAPPSTEKGGSEKEKRERHSISAPNTVRVGDPEDAGKISLTRSDGKIHDLCKVYSSNDITDVISTSVSDEPSKKKTEETNSISFVRSDGLTHDIIQVFKANSDAHGETLKMKSRAPSLGKFDLSAVLASVGNTSPNQPASGASTAQCLATPLNREISSLYYPKHVRIVHFSDTHNFLVKTPDSNHFLPHGNIFVHTGNFTNGGTDMEFMQFNEWLGSVCDLYHYRVVIFGHRDVKVYGNNWDSMRKLLSNATHVLCHDEATILGIRFYGCPWHWGHKANYTLRPGAPANTTGRFDDIPNGVQVLLTHGPAFDRLDMTYTGLSGLTDEQPHHWGSRELAEAVKRVKPSLHLHGHIKDSRGLYPALGNAPMTVNSSMVDKDVTVMYTTPHVIKATQAMFDKNRNLVTWSFAIDALIG